MNSLLTMGIVLTAIDKMSGPVSRTIGAVSKNLDTLSVKATETGRKMTEIGTMTMAAGEGMRMALASPLTAFADLDEAQRRLKTNLMDTAGTVGPEYEKLTALADRLGVALPGSSRDMLDMFTALREQGVQARQILGGTGEAAAQFATVMKLPFAAAATHVAKFSESMGVADKDMVAFMDTVQRLKGASGVETGDLAYTFKFAGPSLKLLNQQGMGAVKDFSAVIGMLAANGMEGSTAGTNMAQALSRMAEIGSRLDHGQVKKMVAPILDKYGIDLNFFGADGNFNGIKSMVAELEKLKALNPQEQILVLKKLFGDEAARPLAILMKQGVAGFDEMTRRMEQQASMQKKIEEIMGGVKMRWETLTGTATTFLATLGATIAQSTNLSGVIDRLNDLMGTATTWVAAHPAMAGGLGKIAVVLALVTLGFGAATLAAGIATRAFGVATGAASKLAGAGRAIWGWTAPARQLGLEIMNSGNAWAAFRYHVVNLAAPLRAAILWMRGLNLAMLANPVGLIIAGIAVGALLIYKYWKPVSGFFRGVWTGIKEGLGQLAPAWEMLRPVGRMLGVILAPLRWIWKAVTSLLKPVEDVGGAAENMGRRFGRVIGGILTAVLTMPYKLFQAGANIINSLWRGMMSVIDKPVAAMKGLAQKLRNHLPFSPAKEGPLRDIHRIKLVETIADGIKPGPMVKALRGVMAAAMVAVSPGTPGMDNGLAVSHGGQGGHGAAITFSPTINITAGTPEQVRGQTQEAMRMAFSEFEAMMRRYEGERQRRGL